MENRFRKNIKHSFILGLSTSLLLSCSSTPELDKDFKNIDLPATWQESKKVLQVKDNWLQQLGS